MKINCIAPAHILLLYISKVNLQVLSRLSCLLENTLNAFPTSQNFGKVMSWNVSNLHRLAVFYSSFIGALLPTWHIIPLVDTYDLQSAEMSSRNTRYKQVAVVKALLYSASSGLKTQPGTFKSTLSIVHITTDTQYSSNLQFMIKVLITLSWDRRLY